ncbi:MAG: lysophospholipid acyltransferase family protein [Candidatus Pacebacteria bacterium]|nr:lysophospholipid acyltransferase family protein [Candidatus Paceibacterota bacterium]
MNYLIDNGIVQRVLAFLLAAYLWFCYLTSRWRIVDGNYMRDCVAGGGMIASFWHNRLTMIAFLWRQYSRQRIRVMISSHRDGQMIARIGYYLRFEAIHGSSKRGGVTALRRVELSILEGAATAITPDGPKGPLARVKPGIIHAAMVTGAPILPVAFAMSRCIRLRSWDRMVIPKPFARGVLICGEPMRVAADADIATATEELERRINDVTNRAEAMVGNG